MLQKIFTSAKSVIDFKPINVEREPCFYIKYDNIKLVDSLSNFLDRFGYIPNQYGHYDYQDNDSFTYTFSKWF